MEWNTIDTAPQNTKKMIVVQAFNVTDGHAVNYTSDPVLTWVDNGEFPRWKHDFKPTHWCDCLPEFKG